MQLTKATTQEKNEALNLHAFQRDKVRCNLCRIEMVVEADGTLPKHWPNGYENPACNASASDRYTRDKKK